MNDPERLESFDDLCVELEDSFVIFCGSAVSRYGPRDDQIFLPLVTDITERFFSKLAMLLRRDNYHARTIAGYANALVAGKYQSVRNTIKFERFLGQLEELLGSEAPVSSFLEALFSCEEGQFTHNHSAIASLLSTGRAVACLTTNFDNALEI
ncbi:MAG TPA: hypothetical protein ENI95_11215, partial [Chloroflexi bacterium]|nr:hypothetical protein [Chloroflexota bacterium]